MNAYEAEMTEANCTWHKGFQVTISDQNHVALRYMASCEGNGTTLHGFGTCQDGALEDAMKKIDRYWADQGRCGDDEGG